MKLKLLALALIPILLLLACNQQTNYQLWTTAGQLTDSWLKVYAPTWEGQKQFDTTWAWAGKSILEWKPGTQCQNTAQLINIAMGLIATIPVTDPKAALILSTAIVGAETVQAVFMKCAPVSFGVGPEHPYPKVLQQAVEKQRATPAKDAKELKQQWKAAGGQLP